MLSDFQNDAFGGIVSTHTGFCEHQYSTQGLPAMVYGIIILAIVIK